MCFICFQKSGDDFNLVEVLFASALGLFTIVFIFLFCEFGEHVTQQFEKLNESFYQCDWYLLPIEMQRMFAVILIDTEKLAIIRGYANTACTRESFKMVISIDKFVGENNKFDFF